jgi:hypothetical protein
MTLQSYEAIYDHGQLNWLGECPDVEEARVIVTVLSGKAPAQVALKHQPSARIAGKGKILGDIISSVAPIDDWRCAE